MEVWQEVKKDLEPANLSKATAPRSFLTLIHSLRKASSADMLEVLASCSKSLLWVWSLNQWPLVTLLSSSGPLYILPICLLHHQAVYLQTYVWCLNLHAPSMCCLSQWAVSPYLDSCSLSLFPALFPPSGLSWWMLSPLLRPPPPWRPFWNSSTSPRKTGWFFRSVSSMPAALPPIPLRRCCRPYWWVSFPSSISLLHNIHTLHPKNMLSPEKIIIRWSIYFSFS